MISINSFVEELVKIAEDSEPEKHRIFDNSPMGRITTTSAIAGGLGAIIGGIATRSPKGALKSALETGGTGMLASTAVEMADHLLGRKRSGHHLQGYIEPKEKIALTLGDVQLIKKQPETTYGKFREGVVGAAKGALTGAGVATLFKRSPHIGAGIGAGAYLLDRNMYGEGEKLASVIPTSPLAFTPARARAARQATSAMQNFTQPRHVGLTPIGGRTGQLRTGAGPKISPPNPGSPV